MATNNFDRVSRLFARRRAASYFAQEATPAVELEKTHYLFVQSFRGGSIAATEGKEGLYRVTLEQGLGHTIYFGDRPSRDSGAAPTQQFLDGLGFSQGNPPNAALLVDNGAGDHDIAVVELFNPTYDATTHTATYEMATLKNWETSGSMGLQEQPATLETLAPTFGGSHLFIDDCPDRVPVCHLQSNGHVVGLLPGVAGMCWSWTSFACQWCNPNDLNQRCDSELAECANHCEAEPLYP